MKQLYIKRLHPNAILPTRATEGSAGFDLYAYTKQEITLMPGEVVQVNTKIALEIDDPHYAAFIYARSGLASKFGIIPANCVGVIDSDYRGEILICLTNLQTKPFLIRHGDRIAQMIIAPVALPQLCEVEQLNSTERGTGGFGSTGLSSQEKQ